LPKWLATRKEGFSVSIEVPRDNITLSSDAVSTKKIAPDESARDPAKWKGQIQAGTM
jgi:hypothetical protein